MKKMTTLHVINDDVRQFQKFKVLVKLGIFRLSVVSVCRVVVGRYLALPTASAVAFYNCLYIRTTMTQSDIIHIMYGNECDIQTLT